MNTKRRTAKRTEVAGMGAQRRGEADNTCRAEGGTPARAQRASQVDPEGWIQAYRPEGIDEAVWSAGLDAFVRDGLRQLHRQGLGSLERHARALALVGQWSYRRGTPLDRELVLDPVNVEQFIQTGLASESSRGTYRSALRQAGRTLTSKAPWDEPAGQVNKRKVPTPYTTAEVAALHADAANQAGMLRLRAFDAFLALGLGAGLDGRWVGRARGVDVVPLDDGVAVRVGEPAPRMVPVRNGYAQRLLGIAEQAGDELLIGGTPSKNRVNHLRSKLVLADTSPALHLGRLRSTWFVAQLEANTHLPAVVDAAGTAGLTTISDLLPFVGRPDRTVAWQQLRSA